MAAPDSFGDRIRRLRVQRGLKQQQLADLVGCSLRWEQNVEAGKTDPRLQELHALALALRVSVSHLLTGEEDPVKRRDFGKLAAALGGGLLATSDPERMLSAFGHLTPVSEQLLGDLEAMTQDYALRHRTTAPRSVLPEMSNHVLRLRGLLTQAPPHLLPRLQTDVAEAAITAGWLTWYVENRGDAQTWWSYALELAKESGNRQLQAHVYVAASSLYSSQGWRPTTGRGSLERLNAAFDLLNPREAPRLQAWILGRRAEEYALRRESVIAYRDLEAATTAMAAARTGDGIWAGARDTTHLEAYHGNVAMRLGKGDEAEASLRRVLAATPANYLTARCWSLLDLSEARVLQEDGAGAGKALSEALHLASTGHLTAYVYRATAIRRNLEPWVNLPEIGALDEQLASLDVVG